MKTILILLINGFLLMVISCTNEDIPDQDTAIVGSLQRGEYLVNIIGCNDCHTPKVMTPNGPMPDPSRLLSGHSSQQGIANINDLSVLDHYALFSQDLTATIGPWGTSFASNLTPDPTGLGNWTYENFQRVFREGKFKGLENGRPILPPMPWQNFRNITDQDLTDIWTYLQSIPPVKNIVPTAIPPQDKKAG